MARKGGLLSLSIDRFTFAALLHGPVMSRIGT